MARADVRYVARTTANATAVPTPDRSAYDVKIAPVKTDTNGKFTIHGIGSGRMAFLAVSGPTTISPDLARPAKRAARLVTGPLAV